MYVFYTGRAWWWFIASTDDMHEEMPLQACMELDELEHRYNDERGARGRV